LADRPPPTGRRRSGSNSIDDKMRDVLQDSRGDLSREEIREEIKGSIRVSKPNSSRRCGLAVGMRSSRNGKSRSGSRMS
jgi:hypothetical protein